MVAGRSDESVSLGGLEWSAIALFSLGLGLSVFVLMPSQRWIFWHQPQSLLAVYFDPGPPKRLSEFRRAMAYYNGEHLENNASESVGSPSSSGRLPSVLQPKSFSGWWCLRHDTAHP